jgi:hypothetical protein
LAATIRRAAGAACRTGGARSTSPSPKNSNRSSGHLLRHLVQRIEVQRERRHGRASAPHAAVTPDPAILLWLQLRRRTTPQRNARQIDLLV